MLSLEKGVACQFAANPVKGAAMDRFFNNQNIERYRKLASESTSGAERKLLLTLLAEDKAKFIELQKRPRSIRSNRREAISLRTSESVRSVASW